VERVCFLLQVRPERLDEYRERHAAVWPDMVDARWQAEMAELMVLPEGTSAGRDGWTPDRGLLRLQEVFHLA
jgi:L-rhamnose mutarotase